MASKKPEISAFPRIGSPATRALEAAGYTNLQQLTKVTEAELAQLHGMGPKALGLLREALKAKGWAFKPGKAGEKLRKKGSPVSRTDMVEAFLRELSHPLKAEVEAVRSIILGVDEGVAEEIKWNAPSFNYRGEYLVTFNLRETTRIHLVFHNPRIVHVKSVLLEGNYVDRRMAYFADMKDVKAKKLLLERALKDLIKLQQRRTALVNMNEKDVDNYLETQPADQQAVLENIRQIIKALSPEITELISYGIPSFKYKGRQFVAFAAYPSHCNFLIMSYPIMETFKSELKRFETDRATIRFTVEKPLPAALLKKLIKARMAEVDAVLAGKPKSNAHG